MRREMFNSKLHRGRVTSTDLDYEGSITIGTDLLDIAGIYEYERVQVVNATNGERLETYTISGGDGEICLNGAAARLAEPGDVVIIISYGTADPQDYSGPTTVLLDKNNNVVEVV